MDYSFQTRDQPHQFWSHPLQAEIYPASDPRDHLSPHTTRFNVASGALSENPDPFFMLNELDSYPSSGSSPRYSKAFSGSDWINSESTQLSVPEISPSGERKDVPKQSALSHAQSRRRSQNRTAQRAFRERKERHVKELEAQIIRLKQESKSVGGENERLRKEIAQLQNKNLTLRATNDHDDLDHYVEYASWRLKQ